MRAMIIITYCYRQNVTFCEFHVNEDVCVALIRMAEPTPRILSGADGPHSPGSGGAGPGGVEKGKASQGSSKGGDLGWKTGSLG